MLYSFGGVSRSSVTARAFRFDGSAWQSIAVLPQPREYSSAVSDGRYIYILGGLDAVGTRTTSMYRYDPSTDSYQTMAPFTAARFAQGAVALDGYVYLFAGQRNNPQLPDEVYNIVTNSWASIAAYPLPVGFVVVSAWNGFIYSAGGVDVPGTATNKTYRYDPATNQWDDAAIADLPVARWAAASALYRSDWLVAGGYVGGSAAGNISGSALAYAPLTDQWTAIAPMAQPRARMGGGSMTDQFFSPGGRSSTDTFVGSSSNQRFVGGCPRTLDPADATATAAAPTPTSRIATPTIISGTLTATPTVQPLGAQRAFLPLVQR